eukprot:TRINITY_DN10977_c0_g1_i1.p1 TRINITY_DN10977_c0_g1~~TRINITY_DN10977_c0_g1_i1.p1  ORF type:complete len:333 (-),score=59.33 TRINITY_DN10977_c0_g1_i1:155-1153(-)
MADKPSRALVIYGDGLMPILGPFHSHLHSLASLGCCGLLALRDLPPHVSEEEREVRELAQLLDVYDLYSRQFNTRDPEHSKWDIKQFPSVSKLEERFMGMKAAMITNSCTADLFGKNVGFHVTLLHKLLDVSEREGSGKTPDPHVAAFKLLSMLGIKSSESAPAMTNEFELVFVHLGSNSLERKGNDCSGFSSANSLWWIDSLIGAVLEILHHCDEAANCLHLSAVLSYGAVAPEKTNDASLLCFSESLSPSLSVLYPRQSYTMKSGKQLNNVRNHHPLLVTQYQRAVTRSDEAKEFSFKEFQENGGNISILADNFLYEIAFKLWKAPKYGA